MTTRRLLLAGGGAALLNACAPPTATSAPAPAVWTPPPLLTARLDMIEARIGGRLGLTALDTGSGHRIDHRSLERFALASTFKWILAANVLHSIDGGHLQLDSFVRYTRADLLPHSPITEAHVRAGGLPIATLCEAAVTQSDNCAANLLLVAVNGPAGLTAFLRANGDGVTRLDRTEMGLNENAQGDPRDTTTMDSMVTTMRALLLGDVLSAASRERLIGWLVACETGRDRLRAGLPQSWRVGDKTGTGARGAVNDLAIAYPPNRAPILISCYMSETTASTEACAGAQAEIGSLVAAAFA